jgi:membrane-bound metal-dependent hydrolase YbcI (DUF457 family)
MPGYKGHITGALLFCGLLYLFPFWYSLSIAGKMACVGIAVFFGLWPDVDTKSKGQTLFLWLFVIVDAVLLYREEYKRAAYLGLLIVLPVMARHRSWTHSIVSMVMLPCALFLSLLHYSGGHPYDILPYALAALFGYASHLVLDRYL